MVTTRSRRLPGWGVLLGAPGVVLAPPTSPGDNRHMAPTKKQARQVHLTTSGCEVVLSGALCSPYDTDPSLVPTQDRHPEIRRLGRGIRPHPGPGGLVHPGLRAVRPGENLTHNGILICDRISVPEPFRGRKFGLLPEALVIEQLGGITRLPVCTSPPPRCREMVRSGPRLIEESPGSGRPSGSDCTPKRLSGNPAHPP